MMAKGAPAPAAKNRRVAVSRYRCADLTRGQWVATSATQPGVVYPVDLTAGTCTCPAFANRGMCRHLRECGHLHQMLVRDGLPGGPWLAAALAGTAA